MDLDNRKVYGDTFISDGLVFTPSHLLLVIKEDRLGLHSACCTYADSNTMLLSPSCQRENYRFFASIVVGPLQRVRPRNGILALGLVVVVVVVVVIVLVLVLVLVLALVALVVLVVLVPLRSEFIGEL